MSASLVVGPGTAAYGAAELKQAAHKFGLTALCISIVIHFSIIGLYYLVPESDNVVIRDFPTSVVHVAPHPYIPGVYTPPPEVEKGTPRHIVQDGTPIPVSNDPESLEKTLPTQSERVDEVDPRGAGGSDEGTKEIGEIPVDENVPPEPFVPVERYPEIVKAVAPAYPALALQAGLEGKVFVKVWVDKQGKPRQVEVIKSDYDIFNEAAIEAAKQYLFTPAYMNNGPVSVWIAIPFTFRLTGAR